MKKKTDLVPAAKKTAASPNKNLPSKGKNHTSLPTQSEATVTSFSGEVNFGEENGALQSQLRKDFFMKKDH